MAATVGWPYMSGRVIPYAASADVAAGGGAVAPSGEEWEGAVTGPPYGGGGAGWEVAAA